MSGDAIDLARLGRERGARLRAAMQAEGLDAVVAFGGANVQYLSGVALRGADSARAHYERPVAVALPGGAVHVFGGAPDGFPDALPAGCRHAPVWVEFDAGVRALAEFLCDQLAPAARVGLDEHTAASFPRLAGWLGDRELVDAGPALARARVRKTRDELECIRRAQQINEEAMLDVLAELRPGARPCDLSARFLRRIFELGASYNVVDPIWQVVAPRLADNPQSVGGDVPFPRTTRDGLLREGDVLWVDTGIAFHGYASDFGRTWLVARDPRPSPRQRAQFERWREVVERVREAVRPGVSGLELVRRARAGCDRPPWLEHLYLAHGVGLSSAELPLLGTDLGEAFDAELVLEENMVLVLEPAIWDEGHGGYRAEEMLAVTADGCRSLSAFPYAPFEGRSG